MRPLEWPVDAGHRYSDSFLRAPQDRQGCETTLQQQLQYPSNSECNATFVQHFNLHNIAINKTDIGK